MEKFFELQNHGVVRLAQLRYQGQSLPLSCRRWRGLGVAAAFGFVVDD